jgi:hypothetical protein
MDLEASGAIDTLRGELRQIEANLLVDMAAMRQELKAHTHQEIASLRSELKGDSQQLRDELTRHARVLFESLRDDIRIVAEGVATLAAKRDR